MKRFLSILLVAVLALGLMATSAFADGPMSIEAKEGEAVAVLKTDGSVTFQSCLVELTLTDGMKLKDVSVEGSVLNGAGDKADWNVNGAESEADVEGLDSMFAWNPDTNKIAFASANDQKVEGVIFTLTFDMGGLETGEVKAKITAYDSDKTGTDEFAVESSSSANITVEASGVLKGDVNGDGTVDDKDRTYLARALAGWTGYTTPGNDIGDVNNDGTVDDKDRTYLARALAGWTGYTI